MTIVEIPSRSTLQLKAVNHTTITEHTRRQKLLWIPQTANTYVHIGLYPAAQSNEQYNRAHTEI